MKIPTKGVAREVLYEKLVRAKDDDVDWRSGRSWSLVYHANDEHSEFLKKVYNLYFSENAASASLFPSLRRMEAEVVSMLLNLVDGNSDCCGTMTSGGTESILLAMKAYRDHARIHKPQIKNPEILLPESAHPAFIKAAQYFDLGIVPVPLNDKYECNVDRVHNLISDQTICVVASAPSFPHGVMDPVSEMGEIALARDIGLHVDACLGGLLLPFVKRLGYEVPAFGFDIPGVTSISTDLHKNGYAAKGASAILYRTSALRRQQFFISPNWPGGIQASSTMLGTKPGGSIAAAWAALMVLGEDGYLEIARRTMETTEKLISGITQSPDLQIVGNPIMNVFGFRSNAVDVFALGDRIDAMGWRINRQNHPVSLHLVVTPNHAAAVSEFLEDLETALSAERQAPKRTNEMRQDAILYGGVQPLNPATDPEELMLSRIEEQYLP